MSKFCEEIGEPDLMNEVYKWKALQKFQSLISPRPSTLVKRLIAIGTCYDTVLVDKQSEVYCPITNKWKFFDQFKCVRNGFHSIVLGDELFFLGGHCPIHGSELNLVRFPFHKIPFVFSFIVIFFQVEKYNFSTKQLTVVEPMAVGRDWPVASILNNEIFVAGGRNTDSVER